MNNLHAPTVPSGLFSSNANNGSAGHLSFGELQRRKLALEEELKALGATLESHGVTMDTSLLTRDGFPRSDIDVAQVRTARARVIHLRNDYKDIMAQLEKHLHEHFASLDDTEETHVSTNGNAASVLPDSETSVPDEPFAKVDVVAPGSPADLAGLKEGDIIRSFGDVNKANHDNLKKVAECVQGNEGILIPVQISRNTGTSERQELRLTLTPTRDWGGRGMLGCRVLPL